MASADLRPGDKLRHKDGKMVTLDRRKHPDDRSTFYLPGWWLTDGSGLADRVIDSPTTDWEVI